MFDQSTIDIIGWIYFTAWSLSFYGQLLLNYKLKRYLYFPTKRIRHEPRLPNNEYNRIYILFSLLHIRVLL